MRKKNRTKLFILLTIPIFFTPSFLFADQRIDPTQFDKEKISSDINIGTQTVLGKAHREALQIYQKTKQYKKSIEILQKGKVDEAISKSAEQISLTKGQYTALLNDYAYFLYLDKQSGKALPILNRVIELNPERAVAYLNRGDIYRDKFIQTKDNKFKELYAKDYKAYNGEMIKNKQSYLVPDRVEKEIYTLIVRKPPIEKGKRIELEKQIIKAGKENRTEEVIRLLEEGTDPNAGAYVAPIRYEDNDVVLYQSENYEAPLHYAAEKNNIEMAKYLINNGAYVHIRTLQRNTPLHFGACSADLEMVKYLLKRGAVYDYPNNNTLMPVAWAVGCEKGKYEEEVFRFLLSLNRGEYINRESLNDMVISAGMLKDHERAYRVTKDLFDKFREKLSRDVLGKGYLNAVTSGNKKLIGFYKTNQIQMDQNEYIIALINAKNFKEAKEEIEKAGEINGDVFRELSLIPSSSTDHKCEKGKMRYEGTELEELLVSAMKKYDVNRILPKQFKSQKDVDYNETVGRFIDQLVSYSKRSPFCLDKERVIKIIKLMLDNGLKLTQFNSQFHYIISLGDIEFARLALQMGVKVTPKTYQYLFANAKSMDMVRFLESEGFGLSKEDFKNIVENKKKYRELMRGVDPQVIEYYESKTR